MPISHLRRTAAAAAVAAGSLAFFAAPAPAQTCYPPTAGCVTTSSSTVTTGPTLSLSSTTVFRNQTIVASASGFKIGTSGIFTIASVEQQIGSFTIGANGAGSSSVTIPAGISLGAHTVFARGTGLDGGAASASQGVTVVAGTPGNGNGTGSGSGPSLARTGAVVVPVALLGAGLVVGGMALKRTGRRGKASKPA